mmetsp:Transcript_9230/g.18153  ORF Transcript_9230/g.18153 Transcript_9230/m.18153 type:complete len:312 (-) Transcript_9230:42-977(-)
MSKRSSRKGGALFSNRSPVDVVNVAGCRVSLRVRQSWRHIHSVRGEAVGELGRHLRRNAHPFRGVLLLVDHALRVHQRHQLPRFRTRKGKHHFHLLQQRLPQHRLEDSHKAFHAVPRLGTERHRVLPPRRLNFEPLRFHVVSRVRLVPEHDGGLAAHVHRLQRRVHRFFLLAPQPRIRHVNNVHQNVRVRNLFQRRSEGRDEVGGELLDEPDRVRDEHLGSVLQPRKLHLSSGGVQRGKEHVLGEGGLLLLRLFPREALPRRRERIEKSRLPRVGVPHEGDDGQPGPPSSTRLHRPLRAKLVNFAVERRHL